MGKKLTKEQFIVKAKAVHGDKYDYSLAIILGNKEKATIICPIHGAFLQTPNSHLMGRGCPKCGIESNRKRFSMGKEVFIDRAKQVHGNKYDYSNVDYVNNRTKVCIICPIHGEFWQAPDDHLGSKGCRKCGIERNKKVIYGFGINDSDKSVVGNYAYKVWSSMVGRCYHLKAHIKRPTYKGCTICDEWKYFSNFEKWFNEKYIEGWELDKDLFSNGCDKIYSPSSCCFLPLELNCCFRGYNKKDKDLPIGVYKQGLKFKSSLYTKDCKVHYAFERVEDALDMYHKARIEKIHLLAEKYKDKLENRVYLKLLDF